jgi:hypothetical protein
MGVYGHLPWVVDRYATAIPCHLSGHKAQETTCVEQGLVAYAGKGSITSSSLGAYSRYVCEVDAYNLDGSFRNIPSL